MNEKPKKKLSQDAGIKGHILVVDDNEMNRDMLTRRLSRRGFDVTPSDSGMDALEKIRGHRYHLVLLDIMMPEVDGIEVLEQVRESRTETELPVIMVTAKDQSEDVVKALDKGANDYVTKPIDFPVLLARVRTHLIVKHLSDQKDEFLRIASHDLKNPLMSIYGSARIVETQLAPGDELTEQMHQMVQRVSKNAKLMQRIIEDFLDFQAMEGGGLSLEKAACDLNHVAREAVESNSDYADQKKMKVELELAESLPELEADPIRLEQVAQNFLSNAIKFSPPESDIVVRTLAENGEVKLEVRDFGPGLTDEDLEKAFTKYARLSNKPTGGEKSSGLGLAISKQMIDLHDGEIGVYNNEDKGATFWFSLPA